MTAQAQTHKAGYPVHAGIDLELTTAIDSGEWLPRTRGDRPGPVVVHGW